MVTKSRPLFLRGSQAIGTERLVLQALQGQSLGIASVTGTASKWRWVFSGGGRLKPVTPLSGSSDLYFTGHEDGRVRVWDVTGHVPSLLTTVPFDSGGPGVRLRAVTCLEVASSLGLVALSFRAMLFVW